MKQKEPNKPSNEKQLERLKYILFPKKSQKSPLSTGFQAQVQSIQKIDKDNCTKNEIRKLREQIYSIFNKQKRKEVEQPETERVYLDGINKICKGLKNYSGEINDVFEDFIEHLPTNLYSNKNNYMTNFFLSMVTQKCVWSKIDSLLKRPYIIGFQAINQESARVKVERQSQIKMKSQREMKHKYQTYIHLNKYFSVWRFKSRSLGLQIQNQKYFRQNNLQNDRKMIKNALQIPMYVLLLQQIMKECSDITQILLYDDRTKRLCKFLEDSQEYLNSSIETVTQRSLLHGETANKKFKRFEFDVVPSLTKLCLDRKQILFIPNLYKHPDFNQIDAICHCQTIDRKKGQFAKGGVILYPIFNSNFQLLGVMRQYFLQKGLKAMHSTKIDKISMLIELGVTFEQHSRNIQKQNSFLKYNYYQKMIGLIKHLQSTKGDEKILIQNLEKQLKQIFQIEGLSVYIVQKRQDVLKDGILLRNIWGKNEGCHLLLSLVDQLMNQQCNYVYLQKRLLIYTNMVLFDIQLHDVRKETQNISNKLLPVDLIGVMMTKVQSIIRQKNEQFRLSLRQQQLIVQNRRKQIQQIFSVESQKLALLYLSKMHLDNCPFRATQKYIVQTLASYTKLFQISIQKQAKINFSIEVLSKQKKQSLLYKLCENKWQKITQKQSNLEQFKIKINKLMFLKFQCENQVKQILYKLKPIIQRYFINYIKMIQIRQKQSMNFQQFQAKIRKIVHQFKANIQFSQMPKKTWQLKQISSIYLTFKKILEQFVSIVFQKRQEIDWNRSEPSDINREQWKQIIYQFVFSEPQKIAISLNQSQVIQNLKQKFQFQLLCNQKLDSSQQSSELLIVISKKHLKSKMSYDSPLVFRLPIVLNFDQTNDGKNTDQRLSNSLQLIKIAWIQLCKTLLDGTNQINVTNRLKAAKITANSLGQLQERLKNMVFIKLRTFAAHKNENNRNKRESIGMIQRYLTNSIWRVFNHIKTVICIQQWKNKLLKIDNKPLNLLAKTLSNNVLKFSFQKVLRKCNKSKSMHLLTRAVEQLMQKKLHQIQVQSFLQIFQISKLTRTKLLAFNTFYNLYRLKMLNCFNKLKHSNWNTSLQHQSTNKFQILPQQVMSVEQLQQILVKMVPQFKLFLIIDSLNCFALTPASSFKKIVSFQEVNNIESPYLMYQIGSECQLVWHYLLRQSQDCFRIKDKLNNISKFVEQALKNCRELMTKNLVRVFLFKGKWKQSIKCKYLRIWREESDLQGGLQRNRLNDCLYQLSLQSQTMKQKLKSQEKVLKNNLIMFQQLQNKKQQYKSSIKFSESEIVKIQDSFGKLQNARLLYMTLHKRTVFKSCLLIWRTNAQKLILEDIGNKIKLDPKKLKIGLKSVISILGPRYQELVRKSFRLLHNFKSYNVKRKQIQKIDVKFQQPSQRLITFQSQLADKQNQSQNSFRQESPISKNSLYRSMNRPKQMEGQSRMLDLSNEEVSKYNNGAYKLNPKTLKFLKRMGKLQN